MSCDGSSVVAVEIVAERLTTLEPRVAGAIWFLIGVSARSCLVVKLEWAFGMIHAVFVTQL